MAIRHLKIAVDDATGIWRDFTAISLTRFSFPLQVSIYDLCPGDRGAEFFLDFVSPDPILTPQITPGADPFTTAFVYLYVIRISSGQTLSSSEISRIDHWIRERKAMLCHWYIYVFQEAGPLFSPHRPSALFSLPELEQRSTVVIFRPPLRLIDFSVESFRNELQHRVVESLLQCESDFFELIARRGAVPLSAFELRLSHSLLVFYFGFFRTTAFLFGRTYEILQAACDDSFWDCGIPAIEPEWITRYPPAPRTFRRCCSSRSAAKWRRVILLATGEAF
jgi:hypothetical protein